MQVISPPSRGLARAPISSPVSTSPPISPRTPYARRFPNPCLQTLTLFLQALRPALKLSGAIRASQRIAEASLLPSAVSSPLLSCGSPRNTLLLRQAPAEETANFPEISRRPEFHARCVGQSLFLFSRPIICVRSEIFRAGRADRGASTLRAFLSARTRPRRVGHGRACAWFSLRSALDHFPRGRAPPLHEPCARRQPRHFRPRSRSRFHKPWR